MRIVFFTGAGISAESGLATFRDSGGLWEQYRIEDVATPEAFTGNPERVLHFYDLRREQVLQARPNAAHRAIAALEPFAEVQVVTQNVDDLHERSGSPDVHHLHGSLFEHRCDACATPMEVGPPPSEPVARLAPPTCPRCDGRARPGVVWFGEALPEGPWDAAVSAISAASAVLVVGTSGLVHPAASLPGLAAGYGIPVVEVNPGPSGLGPEVSVHVRSTAGQALPALLRP